MSEEEIKNMSHREIEETAYKWLDNVSLDWDEEAFIQREFSRIMHGFKSFSEMHFDTNENGEVFIGMTSPFQTHVSSIKCIRFKEWKELKILSDILNQFLEKCKQEFDKKIYSYEETQGDRLPLFPKE